MRLQPPVAPPIVCIPHAGAGPSAMEPFRVRAGPTFSVIRLPGREAAHREPCLTSIAEMAEFVARELHARELHDVTLFGHSLGALVAYETTRRLAHARGAAVRRLVVSGCRSPTAPASLRLSALADDGDFLRAIGGLGGLLADAGENDAMTRYLLPILRADIAAADGYVHVPGDRLRVPLTVLGGDDDPVVAPRALQAWRDVAGDWCDIHILPGGHFFIFDHIDWMVHLLRS